MPARKRPSPAARGYDHAHRTRAERLRANHIDGTPCWWCGEPMYRDRTRNPDYDPTATRSDGQPDPTSGVLHRDHIDDGDQLLHGLCNKQRGNGHRDHQRPALTKHQPHDLGDLTMGWPAL